MYRYARTRNRVHRVVVEGGKAFKVEQCNLDDVGFLRLEDTVPEGPHCAYCWAGWVEPTPEQAAAEEAAAAAAPPAEVPPGARGIPLVQSTRRMALAALAGALLLGGAAGVLASGTDPAAVSAVDPELGRQLDGLFLEVHALQLDLEALAREPARAVPAAPTVTVVIPTLPVASAVPAPAPSAEPSTAPEQPTASPVARRSTDTASRHTSSSTTTNTTTVIVLPAPTSAPAQPTPRPTPSSAPTPAPTLAPCRHPGVHLGLRPCRWGHR